MEHEDLIAKLDQIRSEIDSLKEANEFDPVNPSPRFAKLISDGVAIKNELDPVLKEIYKNRPVELAEWTRTCQAFDYLDAFGMPKDVGFVAQPGSPEEETVRKIKELMARGNVTLEEWDPLVRETAKGNVFALAEWENLRRLREQADKSGQEDKAKESES